MSSNKGSMDDNHDTHETSAMIKDEPIVEMIEERRDSEMESPKETKPNTNTMDTLKHPHRISNADKKNNFGCLFVCLFLFF